MSPTVAISSQANWNVSAATAQAAASSAANRPQPVTLAKAINIAMVDAMNADTSVNQLGIRAATMRLAFYSAREISAVSRQRDPRPR